MVMRWISSREMPRLMASYTTKIRSSSQLWSSPWISSSVWGASLGMERVSSFSSMERTAFIMACSKLTPMDITSPVAFIWVPRVRLP